MGLHLLFMSIQDYEPESDDGNQLTSKAVRQRGDTRAQMLTSSRTELTFRNNAWCMVHICMYMCVSKNGDCSGSVLMTSSEMEV